MEAYLINDSIKWKKFRDKRRRSFVRLSTIVVMFTAIVWLVISLGARMWLMAALIGLIFFLTVYNLRLIRQNRFSQASLLLIIAGALYFTTVCWLTTGPLQRNHTTHTWFIALALVSYFLLFDFRPLVREGVPAMALLMAFLFHFELLGGVNLYVVPATVHRWISMADMASVLFVIFFLTRMFVMESTRAEEMLIRCSDRLESLIENILPVPIAVRLQKEGKTFSDFSENCSVLFADIVNFTPWSDTHPPGEVVEMLNGVFSKMDDLAEALGLTKIKTIGDSYMVAAGIPASQDDHAVRLLQFADRVHREIAPAAGIRFRAGICSGPVVAGIIGRTRITYDLWGDTVNVASRLESHAPTGGTLVSESTYELLRREVPAGEARIIPVKGKGDLKAYVLNAPTTNG